MLSPYLERVMAQHCAPTLLGAKSANLISVDTAKLDSLSRQLLELRRSFPGLGFRLLCRCKERILLLVYRPAMLEARLKEPEVHDLLVQFGYPSHGTPEELLTTLSRRMDRNSFPHEIGLFLDYPPRDVLGFIRNGGNGGKLCRYWKVYDDVAAAEERFACYDTCRSCLNRLLALGQPISTLFQTA